MNFPEGFLTDKIFKIIYDANSNDKNIEDNHDLHYVMLKVSKINSSGSNKRQEENEDISEKYLL